MTKVIMSTQPLLKDHPAHVLHFRWMTTRVTTSSPPRVKVHPVLAPRFRWTTMREITLNQHLQKLLPALGLHFRSTTTKETTKYLLVCCQAFYPACSLTRRYFHQRPHQRLTQAGGPIQHLYPQQPRRLLRVGCLFQGRFHSRLRQQPTPQAGRSTQRCFLQV